jgi:hypothetical protein
MPQENTDPIIHPSAEASTASVAVAPLPPSPVAAAPTATAIAATPESLANLISEARKDGALAATQHLQQSVQAIAEMCLIAGCPDRAAQFIAAGKTEMEVRRSLIEARASASDALGIQSTLPAASGTGTGSPSPAASPQSSPIVAAVKKLNSKE